MLKGPKIKLAVNLHRLEKYFPLDMHLKEGFDYDWIVEREKFNEVKGLLKGYSVSDDQVTSEFCFILLWIEKETSPSEERDNLPGKFDQMWAELDSLKEYLLRNRVISVTFKGETTKYKAGEELTLSEDINIDRICDAMRSAFREEFSQDKLKRRSKGLTAWQARKMVRIRNNVLNYFTSVPVLDDLSLEEQSQLIDKISELAGLPGEQPCRG
jgi:hypothetical protein